MLKEFRDFAMKGNVVDMAVGIIIGAAFGTIVASLVADIIMPPIGMLLGGVDFTNIFVALKDGATAGPYPTLAAAQAAGAVTMNVGMFLNKVFSFIIVAFSVFMLVKAMNKAKRAEPAPAAAAPTTKECPFCLSSIPLKATRCAHCASDLK
jgi:large conductance mechanosensitive channel